jgi:hypothetical protein
VVSMLPRSYDTTVQAPAVAPVYRSSPIKSGATRRRRTQAEMAALRDALYAIAADEHPTTDRHIFYVAVAHALVAKTEQDYKNVVCRLVLQMRRSGRLPHEWIANLTRWMRKPRTYLSLPVMLSLTAQTYRRALWAEQPHYVEVWCEKDAIAGILYDATNLYDVPLMVARGFTSESFLFNSAQALQVQQKPAYIYYFGDLDPSGVLIAEKIEAGLGRLAPTTEIHFERVAVTTEQVHAWALPTRPTKESSHSRRGFAGKSVEIDAVSPRVLRQLAEECIARHLDPAILAETEAAEESERNILANMAAAWSES